MPMPPPPQPTTAPQLGLFGNPGQRTSIILALIGAFAICIPALIVEGSLNERTRTTAVPARLPVIPAQEIPPVEPVKLVDLPPDAARTINAGVPFSTAPNPAARPFRLGDTGIAAARAIDCMATAVLYEAGDDTGGQRAVAQVIINRVRHPAFPKTICGVVFQGAERRTGCQFTFTCDGALARRRWSDAAWMRARTVATGALHGQVFAPVGHSTHYHTDWVVPYWSASLDKVSAVGTHLFFRWTGWWGTPPAFNRTVATDEPAIAQLAQLSPVHNTGTDLLTIPAGTFPPVPYVEPYPVAGDPNAFLATIDRSADPESFRKLAEDSCGARPYCKYMAWSERFNTPVALPLEPFQVATMSFSYLRDRARGFEKALWRCTQFPRADRSQCMKAQTFQPEMLDEAPAAPPKGDEGTEAGETRALGDAAKPGAATPPPIGTARTRPRVAGTPTPKDAPARATTPTSDTGSGPGGAGGNGPGAKPPSP